MEKIQLWKWNKSWNRKAPIDHVEIIEWQFWSYKIIERSAIRMWCNKYLAAIKNTSFGIGIKETSTSDNGSQYWESISARPLYAIDSRIISSTCFYGR